MENTTIYLDFDDIPTYQILSNRYIQTAKILGIGCDIIPSIFGEAKVHVKLIISGDTKDIERFMEFIDESMKLLKNDKTI